jgi:hypothetical protein
VTTTVQPGAAGGVEGSGAAAGRSRRRHPATVVAFALLGFAALYVLFSFDVHGISNDEEVQHVYGRLLVDFYASGFSDRSAFGYKNLYLYGGLFDLIAAALERVSSANIWDLRHLLSALFGLAGLAGSWLLARRLAGEWAGVAALALLLMTGAWSGAMFTHTKDVPFAAAMVWALLFISRLAPQWPRPSRADLTGLGLALGCAFGLRVGAVFAVFYLGVSLLAAAWLGAADARKRFRHLARSLRALLPAALLALALTALFWPWAVMSPGNLLKAMTAFSHFAFELDTVLDGEVMRNGEVPGTYLAAYLLVRLPETFLAGLALAAVAGWRALPALLCSEVARRNALPWLPLVLADLVPLAFTLLAAPPLYNGVRHFTFLLPPLAVLAAAGFVAAWTWAARRPWLRAAALSAGLVALGAQAAGLARLHPYEYVDYNLLAGSLQAAPPRWEKDYWGDSLRAAAGMLEAKVASEAPPARRYRVAVCAELLQADAWLSPRFEVTRDWRAADFFLSTTHMGCHRTMQGAIIGEVAREGVVLAVVRDRRTLRGAAREPR